MMSFGSRHRVFMAVAIAALLTCALSASAQSTGDFRVVRRADRRGIIVLLKLPLRNGDPQGVAHFALLDRAGNALLLLKERSNVTDAGCGTATRREERVCLDLADAAPSLIDAHSYVLVLDSIPVLKDGKPAFVGANVFLAVAAVGARVQPLGKSPLDRIEVDYDIDATNDSSASIELSIGGRKLPIPPQNNTRPGQSLCYNPNALAYICNFDPAVNVHDGEKVTAKFVRAGAGDATAPAVAIAPVTYANKDPVGLTQKDQSLYSLSIQGGYSKTTTTSTATLQVMVRDAPFALQSTHFGEGGFIRYTSLSPYLDLLVSTDASTKGYIDPGLQFTGLFIWDSRTHFLNTIATFITPRAESDKKGTVMNFIPLDVVIRPGLGPLSAHSIPLGGSIQLWPDIGLEQGWTVKGRELARAESNNPSRWKGGANLVAKWRAPKTPSRLCKVIGCAGFDISADWQHYKLNDVPASASTSNFDYGTLSATYKFTEHAGLSFSFNNGNPPPLFVYQRVESLGLAIVY
jgi:hypothetical protein